MSSVFEGKVRRLGNSMAVIIPKQVLEEVGAKEGDTMKLSIPVPKKKRKEALMKIAGVDAGSQSFTRERGDRI